MLGDVACWNVGWDVSQGGFNLTLMLSRHIAKRIELAAFAAAIDLESGMKLERL